MKMALRTGTRKHSEPEYFAVFNWVIFDKPEDVIDYWIEAVEDLLQMLALYRGVRVRDIRTHFIKATGYDIDFDKLKMKYGWPQFLIHLHYFVQFMLDEDKEESYVFITERGKGRISGAISHIQSIINCTLDKDKDQIPRNLMEMGYADTYLDGHLDCADGNPVNDPSVKNQDLGGAASKIQEERKKKKKNGNRKLSFEEYEEQGNGEKASKGRPNI